MNSTVYKNQTIFIYTCTDSYTGSYIRIAYTLLDCFVLFPLNIWVLWLGTSDIRKGRGLAASNIFTMNMSALELISVLLFLFTVLGLVLHYQNTMLIALFFSGSYLIGCPFMNSLICVDRYMAVAYPMIYRNHTFERYRCICAGLVWLATVAYGVLAVYIYPEPPFVPFVVSLIISLVIITICSLGVLKILLKPSPGETQKEKIHHTKKRAFLIITAILVCVFIAYGLYLLVFIIRKYIPYDTYCVLGGISLLLMRPSSVIQPLLYLSKLGKLSCIKKGSH